MDDLNIERERAADWRAKAAEMRIERDEAIVRAEAAVAELRELRKASAWVPASERMPAESLNLCGYPLSESVLVFTDTGHMYVGETVRGRWSISGVTHWMPLPQGPDGQEVRQ